MAGFKWDDHPVEKQGESFSWDDHPVDQAMSDLELAGQPSELDSAGRGLAQGASFGLRDEAAGALENPVGGLKEIANKFGAGYEDDDVNAYKSERDSSRALDEAAKSANPKSFLAGELGGAVATSFIPGVGISEGANLLGTTARAGAQGGLFGLGGSNAESGEDLLKDTVKGGVIGSLAGAGSYGLSKGIQGATNKVVNATEDLVTSPSNVANRFGGAVNRGVDKDISALQAIPGANVPRELYKEFAEPTVKKITSITGDVLSNIAMKTPEALGKFGQVIQSAAQRGPQAVAATHFILEQTNPEYREQIKQLTDSGGH